MLLRRRSHNTCYHRGPVFLTQEAFEHRGEKLATWSSYKNRNTLKVLVRCSSNGALTFLSDVYGGRINGKELTRKSGLKDMLESGDSFICWSWVNIDSLRPDSPVLRCALQYPAFTRRSCSARATSRSQHIKLRHSAFTGESNGEDKNYCITACYSISLAPLASDIIAACSFLTLFDDPLVLNFHSEHSPKTWQIPRAAQ